MRSALIIYLLLCASGAAAEIAGPARVIDGDTLQIGDIRIRLHGIDAPEAAQDCRTAQGFPLACGTFATDALRQMTEGQTLHCTATDTDRYGRTVARCAVGNRDLGQQMVQGGYAIAYRKYAMDYVQDEAMAKQNGLGFWSANMQRPADYRAAQRKTAQAPGDGCTIKGNISGGVRIYHMPGQAFYDATRISTARGEHWFCSVTEAQAAGWRAARR